MILNGCVVIDTFTVMNTLPQITNHMAWCQNLREMRMEEIEIKK